MSQSETQQETAKGWSPRTLRMALLGSLALNLLGIGLIAGTIFGAPPHHSRGEFGLKTFSYTLPEERGKMMRAEFQAHKPAIIEMRKAARTARSEAIKVLAAEPYDAAQLSAALARLNDAEANSRQRVSEFLVTTAGKLTPEERAALAESWRKRHEARQLRHGQHHSDQGAGK